MASLLSFILPLLLLIPSVQSSHFKFAGHISCTTMDPLKIGNHTIEDTTSEMEADIMDTINGTIAANMTMTEAEFIIPPLLKGIRVELWEKDRFFVDPDDLLNKTITDEQGHFSVEGDESEIAGAEPYLLIIHKCQGDDEKESLKKGCSYESRIDLTELENEIDNIEVILGAKSVKVDGKPVKMEIEEKCG